MMKTCSKCDQSLSEDSFYGTEASCRYCRARAARDGRARRKSGIPLDRSRFSMTAWRYRVEPEFVDYMLMQQNGRCAVCGTSEPGGKHDSWNIDHDHSCCSGARACGACVRGLLCSRCNLGLGYFKDSVENLRAAIDYLERGDGCPVEVAVPPKIIETIQTAVEAAGSG